MQTILGICLFMTTRFIGAVDTLSKSHPFPDSAAIPGIKGHTAMPKDKVHSAIPEKKPAKPVRTGLYHETRWDPLLESKTSFENLQNVLKMSGYYENHNNKSGTEERYGDVDIFTLNLAHEITSTDQNELEASYIREILDHAHPTVLSLQGVRESVMNSIRGLKGDHYTVVNDDMFDKDAITSAHYFIPIIIDIMVVDVLNTGYIKNSRSELSSSYAILRDIKSGKMFVVINMDLFSTFKEMTEGQFVNIIRDIHEDPEVSNLPIFFAGGIGAQSEYTRTLIATKYKNLVDLDPNNKDLDRTTVHGPDSNHSDGVQRDFILLRDANDVMVLNYARILSKDFDIVEHYPVNAILSFSDKDC